jgi:hypothetical protein
MVPPPPPPFKATIPYSYMYHYRVTIKKPKTVCHIDHFYTIGIPYGFFK